MTMNGSTEQPQISKDGQDVINVLRELIREAEAGRLVGVGIVTVKGPGNLSLTGTKNYPLEMLAGCDFLKDHIKSFMVQSAAQQQQAQQGRIVKPPAGLDPSKLRG